MATKHGAVFLEAHPPTSVTHCAAAYLTWGEKKANEQELNSCPNLVTVRSNYIDVYAVNSDGFCDHSTPKLELLASQRLFGTVESLGVLRQQAFDPENRRDALMLTFRDAKLSVLRWDDDSFDLVPSSLHYFESDVSLKTGRLCFPSPPFLAVDPQGRCAAVLMFRHQLAILPGTASEYDTLGILEEAEVEPNKEQKTNSAENNIRTAAVGNSYLDNLGKIGVRDVRDAVFLHGTSEPTLLCLHEGDPSWPGNLKEKKDSCCLSALSVNMTEKRHPKIWEATDLPSDSYKLVAAPDGGALVFTGTSVLFYNQGYKTGAILHSEALPSNINIPPMSFNLSMETPGETAAKYAKQYGCELPLKDASSSVSFCDKRYASWNLDLSAAHVTWISSTRALLCLYSGQIISMYLKKGPGGTRVLEFTKTAAGPQPASIANLANKYIFVGSCGGDSLLLSLESSTQTFDAGRETKRLKTDHSVEIADLEQKDETREENRDAYLEEESLLSIYQEEDQDEAESRIKISVCDNILSLGAMRNIIALPAVGNGSSAKYLAICGTSHNGCLAVLDSRVTPEVITEVPLPNIKGAWSIGCGKIEGSDTYGDAYLLLSFENNTKVLSAGSNLKEVSNDVEFATDVKTIAAGTFYQGNNVYEVQVTPVGVRILQNGKKCQDVMLQELDCCNTKTTIAGHICDPIVLLELSQGSAIVFELINGELEFVGEIPTKIQGQNLHITAACIYKDEGMWLSDIYQHCIGNKAGQNHFIWTCYSNGDVLTWSIPAIRDGETSLWRSNSLSSGVGVVVPISSQMIFTAPEQAATLESNTIVDIRVSHFLSKSSSPFLIAITDVGTMYCYKFFKMKTCNVNEVRLKRMRLKMPTKSFLRTGIVGKQTTNIYPFQRIGEHIDYSGFFIGGNVSCWLIVSKGTIYAHLGASGIEKDMIGFTPFNNANCPHGFIGVRGDGSLLIANFASKQRLDAPWPRRKLGIKSVPIDCSYYPEGKLVAVLASAKFPHRDLLPEEGESEPQASYSYALAAMEESKRDISERHEILLVNPTTWLQTWRFGLLPGETGLAVEAVHLKDASSGATVPMIVVGTAFSAGEDYPCSGRVILVEITKSEETGTWNGQIVYSREFKGPVTALSTVEGYLLLSTGNRIETCILRTSKSNDESRTVFTLQRSSFYEGPSLVTCLHVVKNFLLLGDVQHGINFLRYKEQGKQINLLAKDFGKAGVRSCQFLIAGSSLHMVVADREGNLWCFTYAPNDPKSWKGQKLERWGSFHIGKGVSCMLRTKMLSMSTVLSGKASRIDRDKTEAKQGVLCGTDTGGIHIILPLSMAESEELVELVRKGTKSLILGISHSGGLNPSAFRRRFNKTLLSTEGAKLFDPPTPLYSQGILDGELLLEYLHQSIGIQSRIASMAGTDQEVLAMICDMLCLLSYSC